MKTRKGARPPLASLEELRWDAEIRRIRARTVTADGECCVVCQRREPAVCIDHHHPSYLRPTETIALCRSHHTRLHRRLVMRGRDPVPLYFAARKSGVPAPFEAREWGRDAA